MKFSEALRLGAMQLPEPVCPLQVFERDKDGRICSACALGAAAFAVGIEYDVMEATYNNLDCELLKRWPWLSLEVVIPTMSLHGNVAFAVSTLFEMKHWTREAIADWVETLEAQHAQPVTEQPADALA